MVELRTMRDGTQSIRINYDIFKKGKTVAPISRDMKEELKDGIGNFELERDLLTFVENRSVVVVKYFC